ncbi:MAG: tRNA (N(6)-L-threonylcarbamoyladenosine(37)-C(2))-methylthiotransferase MtaB [Sedimentisphaerales bacterium]|nr:tRNA (N(6)-L-threonylcarbamoyladenosine(37)-C(2))-methylthiotransferase MtaB [Sedimentisphaerales bacterium]
MKYFSIYTLGCKANQYESQQIRELLENFGLKKAESSEKTDLVVINTCCVTHTASAKSRQQIRKFQKHHPDAAIVICGCLPVIENSTIQPDTAPSDQKPAQQAENTLFVTNRDELAAILTDLVSKACNLNRDKTECSYTPDSNLQPINMIKTEFDAKIKLKKGFSENTELPLLTSFKDQTRAFLKVQDGCDGYCAYCIIPKTRPEVRSKPVNEAINEAKSLVLAGHKEIVITGICVGAYGRDSARRRDISSDNTDHLANLVEKIAQIPNLKRIRLSSIEPSDITDQLLDTFSKYENIMPHIHLSLQSGSDAVLKKMCRRYKSDDVRKKVDQIKNILDTPAITTDIIVGFPGETDEDFEQTVKLSKEIGFSKIHVFKFSAREGTAAARMKDFVDSKIINERSKILLDLEKQLGFNFRNQFIDKNETVLIENIKPIESHSSSHKNTSHESQVTSHVYSGRSERYFIVNINQSKDIKLQKNDVVKVLLQKNTKDDMTAKPISK